jgi:NTP pyrophosphatase (non-canonical NTP hydrolase)
MSDPNSYTDMVRALVKSEEQIHDESTPTDMGLIHMIMGISGEAGELLDTIKKHVIYHKPLDVTNIVEELGDIEFYLEGLRQCINISRVDILAFNMSKLSKRYPQGYSDNAAQERKDKIL